MATMDEVYKPYMPVIVCTALLHVRIYIYIYIYIYQRTYKFVGIYMHIFID